MTEGIAGKDEGGTKNGAFLRLSLPNTSKPPAPPRHLHFDQNRLFHCSVTQQEFYNVKCTSVITENKAG